MCGIRDLFERLARRAATQDQRITVTDCPANCGVPHVLTVRFAGDGGIVYVTPRHPFLRTLSYTCPATGVETKLERILPPGAMTVIEIGPTSAPRRKRHG